MPNPEEAYENMLEGLTTELKKFGVTILEDEWRCPVCGHRYKGLGIFLTHLLSHYNNETRAQIAAFINMGRNLAKQGGKTIEDLGKLLSGQFDISRALEY